SPVRPGRLRTEQVPGSGTGTLSVHLAESLRALGTLAQLDDAALAASRPVRADDVVERRHLTPGQWDPMLIELVQGAGFARRVRADQQLAATVGALDGTLTLAQVVAAVCALTDTDEAETLERVLPAVREMILNGMVALCAPGPPRPPAVSPVPCCSCSPQPRACLRSSAWPSPPSAQLSP